MHLLNLADEILNKGREYRTLHVERERERERERDRQTDRQTQTERIA